jgi:hypothetical protein
MLGKFSRREFAKVAGFSAVGMATAPARSEKGEAKPGHDTPAAASFKTTVFSRSCRSFPVAPQRTRSRTDKLYAKTFQFATRA